MIFVAISNVMLLLLPPGVGSLQPLGRLFYEVLLALQILFYGLAWLGARPNYQVDPSKFRKMVYLATFLVNSNLAALKGFIQFARGQQSHIWDRTQRR